MSCRPMFCEGRADCGDRHCPGHPVNSEAETTRRVQEIESRWAQDIGVEAADAPRVTGAVPPIVTTELRPVRKPLTVDWQGVVIYGGVVACMFAIAWLSTADPRDLSSFWPRVLAALSF